MYAYIAHLILKFEYRAAREKYEIKDFQKGVMTVNLLQKLQGALLQNENTHSILYLSHHLAYDDDRQTIYKSEWNPCTKKDIINIFNINQFQISLRTIKIKTNNILLYIVNGGYTVNYDLFKLPIETLYISTFCALGHILFVRYLDDIRK